MELERCDTRESDGGPEYPVTSRDELYDDDSAWKAAELFERLKFDTKIEEEWEHVFSKKPADFFVPENLQALETRPAVERIVLLARASLHITVTPSMAERYFKHFPTDRRAVAAIAIMNNGLASDGITNTLFGLSWSAIDDLFGPHGSRTLQGYDQYQGTAERRELAPRFLLSNYNDGESQLKSFGDASLSFSAALRRAHTIAQEGWDRLDTSEIFSDEAYQQLDGARKAQLLRVCLENIQFSLVFEETFNGATTRTYIDDINARFASSHEDYVDMHSILYRIRQSPRAYDQTQSYFDFQMNNPYDTDPFDPYVYQRLALAVLNEFKNVHAENDANVDILVEFWSKNRNPLLANAVADALSCQNPQRAAAQLLTMLNQDKDSALASILLRLELGEIGISGEGARYLGRLYDLRFGDHGDYNNPDFFVRRLTAQGDMGVFSPERCLLGRFSLGDLTDQQKHIRAEVVVITQDLLFSDQAVQNQVPELVREELVRIFTEHYFDFYASGFFGRETDVQFNNLAFEEQGWFLYFMHHGDPDLQKRALNMVSSFGANALQTFLSLQYDRHLGDQVVGLSESLVEKGKGKLMQRICDVYGALVHIARSSGERIRSEYTVTGDNVAAKVTGRLLKKATDVLAQAVKHKDTPEHILELLDSIHTENQLLLAEYQVLLQQGTIKSIDELLEVSAVQIAGSELLSQRSLLNKIKDLYRHNYEKDHSPEFVNELITRFEKKLAMPNVKCDILQFGETPLACMVVCTYDKKVEVSALNVDAEFRGAKPGLVMLRIVDSYAHAGKIVEADAPLDNAQAYINTRGFVGVGVLELAGEPLILIERNDTVHYPGEKITKTISDVRKIPEALEGGTYVIISMKSQRSHGNIELTLARRDSATPVLHFPTMPERETDA